MKKTGLIVSGYAVLAAVYSILLILLAPVKNTVFFSGLIFSAGVIVLSVLVTVSVTGKPSSVCPVSLSVSFVSAVYALAVMGIHFLFCFLWQEAFLLFFAIQILGSACYFILLALLLFAQKQIEKQNRSETGRLCEMQTILYEFERIRIQLNDFSFPSAQAAVKSLEHLLDALRFSAFSVSGEMLQSDNQLHRMAARISSEVENLAAIGAEDFSGVEEMIKNTEKAIKERDLQVQLLNRTV